MIELAPHHKRGLGLASPVMNASGVLGFSNEYRGLIDFTRLGAFVTNALTRRRRRPARLPHAVPVPDGILIHTGLPNPGLRAALRRHGAAWQRLGTPVIAHLAPGSPAEAAWCVEVLEPAEGVAGVELGLREEVSAEEAARIVGATRGGLPLIVRLPLEQVEGLCAAVAEAGADALTIAAPPRRTIESAPGEVRGRLYSPANFERALSALRAVWAMDLGLPLIGAGGVWSADQAREMLAAGAVAVQIDAAVWVNPGLLEELAEALEVPAV